MKKYSELSWLILRLGVGTIFFVHGIGKLFNIGPLAVGISGMAGFLTSLGIPGAMFFAWVSALVETFGGLFILVGLYTQYAGFLVSLDILIALILVHLPKGFSITKGGYEYALLLLLSSIALMLNGGNKKWSLANILRKSWKNVKN